MDVLVGTRQCPHLGFANNGLPCCRADDQTREACGRGIANPKSSSNVFGEEPFYCAVLGVDALPAEAIKHAAKLRAEKKKAGEQSKGGNAGFRAPSNVTGQTEARPAREQDEDSEQPIIPTHTLRGEASPPKPNAPCPCGSGKKYKKCCGK